MPAGEAVLDIDALISLGQEAILITLLASAPMLVAGMVVGLTISIVQSVTQIQEITLTFVPKIVVVLVAFVVFLPWMSELLVEFMQELLLGLPDMVRPV
ncbi:MAG: flagellar biosynthesis protein FliQ [Candidatus Hydrogenedentota bacterium]|jgi:flagellar biosynthetic protein FliQ